MDAIKVLVYTEELRREAIRRSNHCVTRNLSSENIYIEFGVKEMSFTITLLQALPYPSVYFSAG